jgi:hypothetical protein
MGFMLAAAFALRLEFFAQALQKSLGTATCETSASSTYERKKARRKGGLKVQGNLEELEKLTVVGRFAV